MSVSRGHALSQPGLSHGRTTEQATADSAPSANHHLSSAPRPQAGWFGLGLGDDLAQVSSTCLLWFFESPRT